jgi:hypothetical protein
MMRGGTHYRRGAELLAQPRLRFSTGPRRRLAPRRCTHDPSLAIPRVTSFAMTEGIILLSPVGLARTRSCERLDDQKEIEQEHHGRPDERRDMRRLAIRERPHDVGAPGEDQ